jgi:hypothetical protein
MKAGGVGGANTRTGRVYEKKLELSTLLKNSGYQLKGTEDKGILDVFAHEEKVAQCFKGHGFYSFLEKRGIDWKKVVSSRLLPDNSLFVIVRDTLFIIEVKYQKCSGSVDEKLQTCDFKRKQYMKLVRSIGIRVEYLYALGEWYKKHQYKDVLDYIYSVNCHYYFGMPSLKWFGLPEVK